MKIIAILVAAGFAMFVADSAFACSMPWVRSVAGMTSNGYMTTKSGKPCTIHFRSAGPTETHRVVQAPSHGTARVGNLGHITYTSKAGYVGQDSFTYVRSGQTKGGGPSDRTVQVTVTVTP